MPDERMRGTRRDRVRYVSDADTFELEDAPPGFGQVRIAGIDAPEREQAVWTGEGVDTGAFNSGYRLARALRAREERGGDTDVYVEPLDRDKYGRVVGRVYLLEEDGERVDLGEVLIAKGLAQPTEEYESDPGVSARYAAAMESAQREGKGYWGQSRAREGRPYDFSVPSVGFTSPGEFRELRSQVGGPGARSILGIHRRPEKALESLYPEMRAQYARRVSVNDLLEENRTSPEGRERRKRMRGEAGKYFKPSARNRGGSEE